MLLTLSPELIEEVLYELTGRDLVVCMLLNKYIYTTITGSIRLWYKLDLTRFGAEDNVFSPLSTNAKLKLLVNSQSAWLGLNPVRSYGFSGSLAIGEDVSLSGGMLYGSKLRKGDDDIVNLVQLITSTDTASGYPNKISFQHCTQHGASSRSSMWLTYIASLREHGLFAEVHSEWEGKQEVATTFKICIYLRPYSSPRARQASGVHHIYVMNCPVQQPFISLQMVGKHIAIIVGIPEDNEDNGQDNIFVYDFRSDVLLLAFRTPGKTYQSIVFLDENLILLPNIQDGSLDIFRIPSRPTFEPIAPLISLDLPLLLERFCYLSITCAANPNPLGASSYAEMYRRYCQEPKSSLRYTLHPERTYFKQAEESLCIFTLRVHSRSVPGQRHVEQFTFVVHRSALLEIVAKYDKQPSLANHPPPPRLRSDYLGLPMQVPLTSRIKFDAEVGHIQREEDSGDAFWKIPPATNSISWEGWGPLVTRWFNDYTLRYRDMTRGWGERCVRLSRYGLQRNGSVPYFVIDFHRSNHKHARRLENTAVVSRHNANNLPDFLSNTVVDPEYGEVAKFRLEAMDYTPPNHTLEMEVPTYLFNRVFLQQVISALPYSCRASAESVKWDRVLIDDQMIVGIHGGDGINKFVEVRYFG